MTAAMPNAATHNTATHNAAAIRSIVEEVVRRIRAEAVSAATASPAAAAVPAQAVGAEKVITLDLIERLPSGTSHLPVQANAVITPSARDRARERGITIHKTAASPSSAIAGRPFIVAHADAGSDAATSCAQVVRGLPHAQQLPATGLADVVNAIAMHASRDAARAILLTSRPATATILANRSASLRAVAGRDAATILSAAAECGANLLIVNPKDLSATNLARLAIEFAGRELAVSAELAAAPAGCGCKSHTH